MPQAGKHARLPQCWNRLCAVLTACDEKKETPPASTGVIELTAVINGAQQVPAKNTTASGTFSGAYTPADRQFSYTIGLG